MQTARSQSNSQRASTAVSPTASTGSGSNLRSPLPGQSMSSAAAYKKAAPPPPSLGGASSSAAHAAPPPYSPSPPANGSSTAGAVAAAKKAPPPPPPLKSKPKPKPTVQYVVALYDFSAQVCIRKRD